MGGSYSGHRFPDHPAVHAMLEALKLGADEPFLRLLARSHGLDRARVNEVVDGLIRISMRVTGEPSTIRQVLVRTPASALPFAQLLAREFTRRHQLVSITGVDHLDRDAQPDLVIEVANYVIPTRRYLPLMAADVPHLAVIRDVAKLQVGPLVIPGQTPCLRCADLDRLEQQREWLVVATQLMDCAPAPISPEVEWLAALQVGLVGDAFLAADANHAGQPHPSGLIQQLIDTRTGEISVFPRSFHAECGCRVLQDTEMELRPRADTTTGGVDALV